MQRSTNALSTRISTTLTYGQGRSFQLPSRHMSRKDTTEAPRPAEERPPREARKKERQISLAALLLPQWKMLALGLLAALGSVAADILQPLPLKIVIDNVLGAKALPQWLAPLLSFVFGTNKAAMLNFAVVSVVLVALLNAVSSYVQSLSMTTVGQWVMHDLLGTLYHQIQRLSLSYHDRSQTGDLIMRVTSDIDTVQSFIASTLMDSIVDMLALIGMVAVMFYFDWKFTLVALSVAPILFIFVYQYTPRIKKATRAVRKKEGEIASKIQEVFSSIRVVKAFGTALVLWYGARLVLAAELTLGGLTTFLAYLGKLYSPIRALSRLPDNFSKPA